MYVLKIKHPTAHSVKKSEPSPVDSMVQFFTAIKYLRGSNYMSLDFADNLI